MPAIFISHSSNDADAAEAIHDWLISEGYREIFLDFDADNGIRAGQAWSDTLRTEMRRARALIVLVSESWRTSPWCQGELRNAILNGKPILPVIVGPVARDKLPAELTVHQIIDYTADPADALKRLDLGLRAAGLDPTEFPWPPPGEPDRIVFRGLEALDEPDAAVFFGRAAEIQMGLEALRAMQRNRSPRLLLITGASGSGKSSLLRAGLIPRLWREAEAWLPLKAFRPDEPGAEGTLDALASAFAATCTRDEVGEARHRGAVRASLEHDAVDAMMELAESMRTASGRPDASILISIDQGEELFRQGDAQGKNSLLQLLSTVLCPTDDVSRNFYFAAITIRADSLGEFLNNETLREIEHSRLDLRSMSPSLIGETIRGPAGRAAIWVEDTLVEQIMQDATSGDALPLLAFCMNKLLRDFGQDKELRLEEYQSMGGLEGAVEREAQRLFEMLQPTQEQREALHMAFVPGLADVNESDAFVRRPARWNDLPPRSMPLIQAFVDARLLVSRNEGEREIEVAHEALLRRWPLLKRWLEDERDDLRRLREVNHDAQAWVPKAGEPRAHDLLIHQGTRLENAEAMARRPHFAARITVDGRRYLKACREREDAERKESERRRAAELNAARQIARRTLAGLVVAVALLIVAGAIGWIALEQRNAAEANADKAVEAQIKAERTALFATATLDSLRMTDSFQPVEGARHGLHALLSAATREQVDLAEAALLRALLTIRFRSLEGHRESINDAAMSPDGRFAVTGSSDACAIVWDLQESRKVAVLRGHSGSIHGVDFDSSGERIVTASRDGTARVWQAATGQQVAKAVAGGELLLASFSSDGKTFVTGDKAGAVSVWDVESGGLVASMVGHEMRITAIAFDTPGDRVATASQDGTAKVWNSHTGELLTDLQHQDRGNQLTNEVSSAEFSPDGKRLVTSSQDGKVRVWSAEDGALMATLDQHRNLVDDATLSPDGSLVASAGSDQVAIVWEWEADKVMSRFAGHQGHVYSVAFSPDGRRVVSAADDGSALVWDVSTGAVEENLSFQHRGAVWGAFFTPDGASILTYSADGTAGIWARSVISLVGHKKSVHTVALSMEKNRIATASADGTVRLWHADDGTFVELLKDLGADAEREVWQAAFAPGGDRIITAANDGDVQVWNTGNGELLQQHERPEASATDALVSPAGRPIVAVYDDGVVRLWPDGDLDGIVLNMKPHFEPIHELRFSPRGRFFLTSSWDGTAVLWNTASGSQIHTFRGHKRAVVSAAFSPDLKRVATASIDGTARVWSTDSGAELARLDLHRGPLAGIAFSHRGDKIATASWDNTARIWDAETFQPLVQIGGHKGRITRVAFFDDDRILATTSWDGLVKLWHLPTGVGVATLEGHHGNIHDMAITPDGSRLVTASEDATARIWMLPYVNGMDIKAAAQRLVDAESSTEVVCSLRE